MRLYNMLYDNSETTGAYSNFEITAKISKQDFTFVFVDFTSYCTLTTVVKIIRKTFHEIPSCKNGLQARCTGNAYGSRVYNDIMYIPYQPGPVLQLVPV